MDIINRQAYTSEEIVRIETKKMRRIISLAPTDTNEIYKYSERCSGEFKGKKFEYSDEIFIRMWDLEFIEKILDRYGLKNTGRDFKQFDSSGSHYRLYSKPN
jgi:hypothetical protein